MDFVTAQKHFIHYNHSWPKMRENSNISLDLKDIYKAMYKGKAWLLSNTTDPL
jgi:hypothetical protein